MRPTPRTDPDATAPTIPVSKSKRPQPSHYVLLVEDEVDARRAVVDLLAEAGYAVLAVADGREALDSLRSGPPPCVAIIDLMMPGMNGWQLIDAMRTDAQLSRIPVVVISARTDAAPPGVRRVVRKPFRSEELVAIVRKLCDQRHPITG